MTEYEHAVGMVDAMIEWCTCSYECSVVCVCVCVCVCEHVLSSIAFSV